MKEKIIILDSSQELLSVLEELLSAKGYSISKTSSLVELFDCLDREKYDLLILEHLPDRDWDIHLVRAHIRKGGLKSCIVTSNYVLQNGSNSQESDSSIVWLKRPFKTEKLIATIAKLLKASEAKG